ncbi:hypothetical protein WAI453_008464 [Rhynchosporium graminicola]
MQSKAFCQHCASNFVLIYNLEPNSLENKRKRGAQTGHTSLRPDPHRRPRDASALLPIQPSPWLAPAAPFRGIHFSSLITTIHSFPPLIELLFLNHPLEYTKTPATPLTRPRLGDTTESIPDKETSRQAISKWSPRLRSLSTSKPSSHLETFGDTRTHTNESDLCSVSLFEPYPLTQRDSSLWSDEPLANKIHGHHLSLTEGSASAHARASLTNPAPVLADISPTPIRSGSVNIDKACFALN